MAFIQKEEPVILNIKLTDVGRRKLSEGNLQFKQIALGDSEIDYKLIKEYGFNVSNISLLRPMDRNPKLLSFIKDNVDASNLNNINNLNSKQFIVDNEAVERGFFEYTNNENEVNIITDPSYIKQKDCEILISNDVRIDGYEDRLRIKKSSSYSTNIREPEIGDYLMIRWTNPEFENTNNFTLNLEKPHPILFYRIVDIISGNLFNNNLIVKVDRKLPDFSGYSGDIKAGVVVYSPNLTGDYIYTTDFVDDAVFSFFENYNIPTTNIPFWNMSLIFTKNVCGISDENKQIKDSLSAKYGGFVNYIQNQSKVLDVLGVIHYTNASPANDYGEGFYLNTAKLKLPTIMWHKNDKMGLTLQGVGDFKILPGLDIRYRDLADDNGNIVGKVFNGLKIFVIEDPELIFALSYKSNRNWTLPNYNLDVNANINFGCPDCNLDCEFTVEQPQSINISGRLTIDNIIVTSQPSNIVCILLNKNTNITETQIILIDNSNISVEFDSLIDGDYKITVYDLSSSDCKEELEFTIETPISNLSITDVEIIPTSDDSSSFILTIDTRLGTGNLFNLPLREGYNYNMLVDWGDGNTSTVTSFDDTNKTHRYSIGGEYQIKINGICEAWYFNDWGDKLKLTSIDQWGNTGFVNMENAFRGCSNLTTVNDTDGTWCSNVTNMRLMFTRCSSLTTIDVSNWDVSNVTNMRDVFLECSSLTTLNVSNWDVSNVTNMSGMFEGCTLLTTLDVSNWDVSNVNTMYGMFANCSSLKTLDVSKWDVSNATNDTGMGNVFYNCTSLKTLDVSKWNVSNITHIGNIFQNCTSLTTIDVSDWDVSNITYMDGVFRGCSSLTTLDLTKWDVSRAMVMRGMFARCSSLTTLDLSNWRIIRVADMSGIFTDTPLDTPSYDALLIGWSQLPSVRPNVIFDANLAKYSSGEAAEARRILTTPIKYWTITDGGQVV